MNTISYITHFFYNESANQLYDLLNTYNQYNKKIKKQIQFIFIDDCSHINIKIPDKINLNIKLLKITDNIQWNQPMARNLGVLQSTTDYFIATDIDCVFQEKLLDNILNNVFCNYYIIYTMERIDINTLMQITPHPNTYCMCKKRFVDLYGVDEDFCGHYGHDDTLFMKWQEHNNSIFKKLNGKEYGYIYGSKGYQKNTHNLKRDDTHNYKILLNKLRNNNYSRKMCRGNWTPLENKTYHE